MCFLQYFYDLKDECFNKLGTKLSNFLFFLFLLHHLTVLSVLVEPHAERHNVMSQKTRVVSNAVVGASDFKIEAASIKVCRVGGD
jgi:hypothetical protein